MAETLQDSMAELDDFILYDISRSRAEVSDHDITACGEYYVYEDRVVDEGTVCPNEPVCGEESDDNTTSCLQTSNRDNSFPVPPIMEQYSPTVARLLIELAASCSFDDPECITQQMDHIRLCATERGNQLAAQKIRDRHNINVFLPYATTLCSVLKHTHPDMTTKDFEATQCGEFVQKHRWNRIRATAAALKDFESVADAKIPLRKFNLAEMKALHAALAATKDDMEKDMAQSILAALEMLQVAEMTAIITAMVDVIQTRLQRTIFLPKTAWVYRNARTMPMTEDEFRKSRNAAFFTHYFEQRCEQIYHAVNVLYTNEAPDAAVREFENQETVALGRESEKFLEKAIAEGREKKRQRCE